VKITNCPHCGVKPLFKISTREEYAVMLEHQCSSLHFRVYHHTPKRAAARWNLRANDEWIMRAQGLR